MARRTGPDEAYRLVYIPGSGATAAGLTVKLYADANKSAPADVLLASGAPLTVSGGAAITQVDGTSGIPRLQYPANGSEYVYATVNDGPVIALLSDRKQRDDEFAAIQINVKDFGALGDGSTDDTSAIAAALASAGPGSAVVFPAPSAHYRITGSISPRAGVRVQGSGIGCEIRQATQGKPVFDLLGVDNVTVRGFTLSNGAGTPPPPGSVFRAENGYAYSAGVWTNGNRITVENLRIKDFGVGVYFSSYDGVSALSSSMRVGNVARDLEISGVNFGVLFVCQDRLRIEGIYGRDAVDTSSGANPVHAVYGTGNATLRSRNVTVVNCQARNIHANLPGSAAYQFKYVDGLIMGDLLADSCYGLFNVIDGTDITASNLESINTSADQSTGAVYMATVAANPTRVNLAGISIQMSTADARALNVVADDARLSNIRVTVNRTNGGAAFYDTILRGNRLTMDGYKSRNVGAGNGNAILVGSPTVTTSDVTITNLEIDGSVNIVDVDQTCTGTNVVQYAPLTQRRITNPIATHCRATANGSFGGTATFTVINGLPADSPTAGEIVPPRDRITGNGVGAPSGTLTLAYFTADKSETITTLTTYSGATAAGATPTLCRMGVYSVAASGDLTLVGSTPNDTTLFAATNTEYPKALSSSFTKVAGQRYATALLVVSSATTPTFHGLQLPATNPTNSLVRLAPATLGRVLSQTDLPNSIAAGSVVGFQAAIAMRLS